MLHEQVELTGTVHHGVIVMDDGVELSEGQTVKIIVERPDAVAPATSKTEPLSAYTPLARYVLGIAETVDGLPSGSALNHDQSLSAVPVETGNVEEGSAVKRNAASPLGELLLQFAGIADDLPPDFAKNHDHYLYGAPKRAE